MSKGLIGSRFFNILLLIFLAGFLVSPKISLAEDFKDITPENIEKYLELPEKDAQNLLLTLKQVFTTDWISRESELYSTGEERLIPLILRKAVTIQVLNHLLIEAPIEITNNIIKNAIKIARLFLVRDLGAIFDELEKQSVQKAINYGMNALFENELRVTPGAIEFKYISQKGEQIKAIFQYVLIYQPIDRQRGKVVIRFYSPSSIGPPKSKQSIGGSTGMISDIKYDLPPFIVEITGRVEKDELNSFWWIDEQGRRLTEGVNPTLIQPSVKIIMSEPVPDLGIKPLSFWEKNVLKPIKTTIKEIEVIITKITGKSPKIVEKILNLPQTIKNAWNTIKSTFSKINPFGAGVVQNLAPLEPESEDEEVESILEVRPPEIGGPEPLKDTQEQLDDITEKIDILNVETAELVKEKGVKPFEEEGNKNEVSQEQETEEEEILEEEGKKEVEISEEKNVAEDKDICSVNSVDINTATKEDLQKITEVGPIIAQRIIEARFFHSISDLIRVAGIGEKTLQKIIAQGCAYASGYLGGGGAPPPPK